jgi:hypothetical protein
MGNPAREPGGRLAQANLARRLRTLGPGQRGMWVALALERSDEYMRWRTCRVARPRTPRSCLRRQTENRWHQPCCSLPFLCLTHRWRPGSTRPVRLSFFRSPHIGGQNLSLEPVPPCLQWVMANLKGTGNTLHFSRFGYGKSISTRAKTVNSEYPPTGMSSPSCPWASRMVTAFMPRSVTDLTVQGNGCLSSPLPQSRKDCVTQPSVAPPGGKGGGPPLGIPGRVAG